jgi:hypothetical protein
MKPEYFVMYRPESKIESESLPWQVVKPSFKSWETAKIRHDDMLHAFSNLEVIVAAKFPIDI